MTTTPKKKTRRNYKDKDGNKLPGVTTIIGDTLGWSKGALIGWAHKLGREGRSLGERDEAAALGTRAHAVVEATLLNEEHYEQDPRILANAARVVDFVRRKFPKIHGVEVAITSEQCGGTIDIVAEDERGIVHVVDLKTGKGVYDEVAIQLGAYQGLWELECMRAGTPDLLAKRGLVIHAHPGESLRIVEVSEQMLYDGALVFTHLMAVHALKGKLKLDGTGAM